MGKAAVRQASLIALMGGSSPFANVHVGKCTMSLPSTIALPTNQVPVITTGMETLRVRWRQKSTGPRPIVKILKQFG